MLVPIMLAGLFILGSIGIAFIGLILGIIAVFNKQRNKSRYRNCFTAFLFLALYSSSSSA